MKINIYTLIGLNSIQENDIQKVELITLVKDAIFIYPQQFISEDGTNQIETLNFDIDGDGIEDQTSIQGRFLQSNELNFTNAKPYVIYGYAAVNNGDILNIEAGARLHFHHNSGLLITDNASIHSNGMPSDDQLLMENEIIFEGNRLEDSFSETQDSGKQFGFLMEVPTINLITQQ